MSFWCFNCERKFDYPVEHITTQSRLFGVQELATDEKITVKLCPFCKSDEIEEEDDQDEK